MVSVKPYDQKYFEQANQKFNLSIDYSPIHLTEETAHLFQGYSAICIFVNDIANEKVLNILNNNGIKLIALRCAGFNNIDLECAKKLGITVCRVPEYSPQAVAEHTVGLILTLSRKYHKAYNRVKEDNFALDGLLGFNLYQKTVGIIGTGKIGLATIKILIGFGCQVVCYDPSPNPVVNEIGAEYLPLDQVFQQADILSLHCPLTPQTHQLINTESIQKMKKGVCLINTSRGGLIDTQAIIAALKQKHVGYLGLDVYEQEADLFFEDLSDQIIEDDIFQRLLTFPNVLVTGHQGFFTQEALQCIAETSLTNIQKFEAQQAIPAEFICS